MNPFDIFIPLLINPIINLLVAIYKLLIFVHVPFALGFAIIGLTVVIRFILYPLMSTQLKSAKKMQSVSHHLANLKEKHKGDAKKLQAETMKLYKEHGINPAAGCLPLIIQMPLIFSLYSVLGQAIGGSPTAVMAHINGVLYFPFLHLDKFWDLNFFGLHLAQKPSDILGSMPIIAAVPIVTALLQFVQSKMMLPQIDPKAKLVKKGDDFATAFQSQSTYIFPLMIGFTSFAFPLGMSLYWNTFTVFGIIQQYQISGWGGLFKKKN